MDFEPWIGRNGTGESLVMHIMFSRSIAWSHSVRSRRCNIPPTARNLPASSGPFGTILEGSAAKPSPVFFSLFTIFPGISTFLLMYSLECYLDDVVLPKAGKSISRAAGKRLKASTLKTVRIIVSGNLQLSQREVQLLIFWNPKR